MTESTRPHEPESGEPDAGTDAGAPADADNDEAVDTAAPSASYATIAASSQFRELRHRYRGFAFPATAAFMAWYLLFVVCANWLPGFMNTRVVGNINIALIFGLLQFVSTFLIAWLYARHANRKLDPVAEELNARFRKEVGE